MPYVVLPFYSKWVIGEKTWDADTLFPILAGSRMIAQVVGVPVWFMVARIKGVGKFRAYMIGMLCLAFVQFAMVYMGYDTDIAILIMFMFLWGATFASVALLNDIVNEIIDYDGFLTGMQREAQYIYMKEFVPKFMELPSQAVPFMLMAYFGYDPSRSSTDCPDGYCQPPAVIWTIKLSATIVPAVCIFGLLIILLHFKIRESAQHEKVIEGTVLHSQNQAAVDPLFGHTVDPAPATHDAPSEKGLRAFKDKLMIEKESKDRETGFSDLTITKDHSGRSLDEMDEVSGGGAVCLNVFDKMGTGKGTKEDQLIERILKKVQSKDHNEAGVPVAAKCGASVSRTSLLSDLDDGSNGEPDRRSGANQATSNKDVDHPAAKRPTNLAKELISSKLPLYESRLFYFWPSELRQALVPLPGAQACNLDSASADMEARKRAMKSVVAYDFEFRGLMPRILGSLFISGVLCALGIVVILFEWEKLNMPPEKGGPGGAILGLMLSGVCVVIAVFQYTRLRCALSLIKEFDGRDSRSADETQEKLREKNFQDFTKQVRIMLNFYDGFEKGDRESNSTWYELTHFFTPIPVKTCLAADVGREKIKISKSRSGLDGLGGGGAGGMPGMPKPDEIGKAGDGSGIDKVKGVKVVHAGGGEAHWDDATDKGKTKRFTQMGA